MAFPVPDLGSINEQARKNAFDIDEIPWNLGIDPTKFWGPENFSHLYYCPSYELLNDEEKLFYNQVHGTWIAEQFVFLEELLLVNGLNSLMAKMGNRISKPMREAMETFVLEEKKHSAMFDRLLQMAVPEVYNKQRFVMHLLRPGEKRALDFSLAFPETFLWWIWMAVIFEEKTLDFYRKYKSASDQSRVDPLFHAVHKFHAKDELRHFQLDHHFLELLWDPAPSWKHWLNEKLFGRVIWSFTHPRRSVSLAVGRLVDRFPRLEPHRARLLAEITSVDTRAAWQQNFWSRDVLPHTFALIDRHPEMHRLKDSIPLYHPLPA